jgi:hypothetical protein
MWMLLAAGAGHDGRRQRGSVAARLGSSRGPWARALATRLRAVRRQQQERRALQ